MTQYATTLEEVLALRSENAALRREIARLEEAIAMWRKHSYEVGVRLNQQDTNK